MSALWMKSRSAAGFTLVELLIVLVLLGVIGGIVSASIAQGLRSDGQARSRISALEDMQVAMERVTRDVRAADPILEMGEDRIKVEVRRDDFCHHFTYELNDENQFVATEERFEDDCESVVSTSDRVLLQQLDPSGEIFTYRHSPPPEPADPENLSVQEVAFVQISFTHTLVLDQRPVTVSTEVGIRNR